MEEMSSVLPWVESSDEIMVLANSFVRIPMTEMVSWSVIMIPTCMNISSRRSWKGTQCCYYKPTRKIWEGPKGRKRHQPIILSYQHPRILHSGMSWLNVHATRKDLIEWNVGQIVGQNNLETNAIAIKLETWAMWQAILLDSLTLLLSDQGATSQSSLFLCQHICLLRRFISLWKGLWARGVTRSKLTLLAAWQPQ